MSGQQASFLAGGEFPVPTEVSSTGQVTYSFKTFGVQLKFTPTVKSDGNISLVLDTSVSALTTEGGTLDRRGDHPGHHQPAGDHHRRAASPGRRWRSPSNT